MYVYEEMINGKKLTEIINETHENVKYLPGQKLPENVVSTATGNISFIILYRFYNFKNSIDGKLPTRLLLVTNNNCIFSS